MHIILTPPLLGRSNLVQFYSQLQLRIIILTQTVFLEKLLHGLGLARVGLN